MQVDFEKSATKKLEKELKKTNTILEEERAAAGKHKQVNDWPVITTVNITTRTNLFPETKRVMILPSYKVTWLIFQVAIMLIKERKRLFEKLVEAQRERSKAEVLLASAANKNSAGEGISKRETV